MIVESLEEVLLAVVPSVHIVVHDFICLHSYNVQVRESYRKWWRGKVSESDFLSKHFSSSDMDKKKSIFVSDILIVMVSVQV